MEYSQKMGGIAALIAAATYIVGFVLILTVLAPAGYDVGDADPEHAVSFLASNQSVVYLWNLIIYLVNGVFLVVLVLALFDRLQAGARTLAQTAAAFGLIWSGLVLASGMLIINDLGVVVDLYGKDPAQAGLVWQTLDSVESGLGGGVELVGGIWVLLVSLAAVRSGGLPKALNILGMVAGVAGVLTVVPGLSGIGGDVFGLSLIVWFLWVGIVLLRGKGEATA